MAATRAPIDAETRRRDAELLERYFRTREPGLRDQLVHRFMPLASSLAWRYNNASEPHEDLIQVANLGLLKAIDGFDPSRGSPFSAYAVPTILGELRRHFRDHVWTVRLPRGLGELTLEIERATEALTEELGRVPTPAQIAERLEIPVESVLDGLEASHARRTATLDGSRRADDEAVALIDTLGTAELGYERVESALAAREAMLDERESLVLRMRFGAGLTQREIAERFGVSQMQISRIQRAALWRLLNAVQGEATESPVPVTQRGAGNGSNRDLEAA